MRQLLNDLTVFSNVTHAPGCMNIGLPIAFPKDAPMCITYRYCCYLYPVSGYGIRRHEIYVRVGSLSQYNAACLVRYRREA